SGSGLVGIAAVMAGAREVMASYIDPWAEAAVRLNAEANRVSLGFIGADLIGQVVDADIVLAGDVFYDRAFADALVP
ncbi:methyltransferase, partial [Rhizobium ruizarguesonis]